jgi:hypothetical protein
MDFLGEGLCALSSEDGERYRAWSQIRALTSWKDRLVAGGLFAFDPDNGSTNVAAWDGGAWRPLAEGTNSLVTALAAYGDDLIAAGFFDRAGSTSASHVARWDGARWHAMGEGTDGPIYALQVYNDRLVVGGDFRAAGGRPAGSLAAWDGSGWIALGSGVDGEVLALTESQGSLYVGGEFSRAGGKTSLHLARWTDGPRVAEFSSLKAERDGGRVILTGTAGYLPFDHQRFRALRVEASGARVPVAGPSSRGAQFTFIDSLPPSGPVLYEIAGVASTGALTVYTSLTVDRAARFGYAALSAEPNPFRGGTVIAYAAPSAGPVQADVYDLQGRRVARLLDGDLPAGNTSIVWDGKDDAGRAVPAGIYFCRVSGVNRTQVERLLRVGP